jgi:hypothetical protein
MSGFQCYIGVLDYNTVRLYTDKHRKQEADEVVLQIKNRICCPAGPLEPPNMRASICEMVLTHDWIGTILSIILDMFDRLHYLIDQFQGHSRDNPFSLCESPLERAESDSCLLRRYSREQLYQNS